MNNGSCIPEYLIIEDVEIPIVLERSKRKTLAIGITQEGALKVKAPFSLSETEIIRFVKQKSFWIYKQVKKVEENILDYVVVHELCHLLEMNHSPRFWSQVEKILPDYRERRNWLKKKGGTYLQTKTEE